MEHIYNAMAKWHNIASTLQTAPLLCRSTLFSLHSSQNINAGPANIAQVFMNGTSGGFTHSPRCIVGIERYDTPCILVWKILLISTLLRLMKYHISFIPHRQFHTWEGHNRRGVVKSGPRLLLAASRPIRELTLYGGQCMEGWARGGTNGPLVEGGLG